MAANEIDAVNYKNGQKNHWRRTAWNRVRELLGRRTGIVLYLPGSTNLDEREAVRRGFSGIDLIAIERDETVAEELRKAKTNVIQSDLKSVLLNWPRDRQVAAVIADLQCGYVNYVYDCGFAWMFGDAFRESVLLINLMRGRESAQNNEIRRNTIQIVEGVIENANGRPVVAPLQGSVEIEEAMKNRARQFVYQWLGDLAYWGVHQLHMGPSGARAFPQTIRFAVLNSYKSTERSPYMDSAVLKRTAAMNEDYSAILRDPDNAGLIKCDDGRVRDKISAALAIRTMRLNGQLPRAS